MSTIRASCLVCELVVELPATAVALHLDATGARYGFDCPTCHVYVVRRAAPAVVDALLATEVHVATGDLAPWERTVRPGTVLVDALRPAEPLPALTERDAVRLRHALDDDDALATWLAD